jgi:N-acetylneuraminic acid mutarotase
MMALVVGKEEERALVLGGFGHDGGRLSTHADVFSHEIAKREWTPLPSKSLPEGRSQFGVAEWNGAVWVLGGMSFDAAREKDDQIRLTTQVLRLDLSKPEAGFADAGIQLREPRRAFAGALDDGRYYLVGGMKEKFESVASCDAIDLDKKLVESFPCPSEHRLGAELVALGGKLYLVGGSVADSGGERQATSSVEVYDPASKAWSVLPARVPLDSPDQLRAFAFQGQLLLYSAQRTDGHVQVALLDPEALASGRQDYTRMTVGNPPASVR